MTDTQQDSDNTPKSYFRRCTERASQETEKLMPDSEQKQQRRNMRRVVMPDSRPQELPGGAMVPWDVTPLPWKRDEWR